jgi:hypothetical protein
VTVWSLEKKVYQALRNNMHKGTQMMDEQHKKTCFDARKEKTRGTKTRRLYRLSERIDLTAWDKLWFLLR